MPLTVAEYDFLDAYVDEVYTPSMTGIHTRSVIELGANEVDLSWLLTAYHQEALAAGKTPLGNHSPELLPLPWKSKEQILLRAQELRKELEHQSEPTPSGTC
jgi:hypothetical protein